MSLLSYLHSPWSTILSFPHHIDLTIPAVVCEISEVIYAGCYITKNLKLWGGGWVMGKEIKNLNYFFFFYFCIDYRFFFHNWNQTDSTVNNTSIFNA